MSHQFPNSSIPVRSLYFRERVIGHSQYCRPCFKGRHTSRYLTWVPSGSLLTFYMQQYQCLTSSNEVCDMWHSVGFRLSEHAFGNFRHFLSFYYNFPLYWYWCDCRSWNKMLTYTWGYWGDQDVNGRIILRWIFRTLEGVVGTEWSWLRIGTGGGHLWVRWGTFGFHKCGEFLD